MKYYGYSPKKPKADPLTQAEIEEKYKDIQDEMNEVLEWKKEEEAKLKDKKASHQKISAAKRALKKVDRRIDTVNGQILYWKMRKEGQTHFRASLEMNEYWAACKEKKDAADKEQAEKDGVALPEILKNKKKSWMK